MKEQPLFVETLFRGETTWKRDKQPLHGPNHVVREGFASRVHQHDERRVQGLRLVTKDGKVILAMSSPSRLRTVHDPARES